MGSNVIITIKVAYQINYLDLSGWNTFSLLIICQYIDNTLVLIRFPFFTCYAFLIHLNVSLQRKKQIFVPIIISGHLENFK